MPLGGEKVLRTKSRTRSMEGTGKNTRRGETAEAGGRAVCSEAFANVQARNVEHGRQ